MATKNRENEMQWETFSCGALAEMVAPGYTLPGRRREILKTNMEHIDELMGVSYNAHNLQVSAGSNNIIHISFIFDCLCTDMARNAWGDILISAKQIDITQIDESNVKMDIFLPIVEADSGFIGENLFAINDITRYQKKLKKMITENAQYTKIDAEGLDEITRKIAIIQIFIKCSYVNTIVDDTETMMVNIEFGGETLKIIKPAALYYSYQNSWNIYIHPTQQGEVAVKTSFPWKF